MRKWDVATWLNTQTNKRVTASLIYVMIVIKYRKKIIIYFIFISWIAETENEAIFAKKEAGIFWNLVEVWEDQFLAVTIFV